MKTAVGAVSVRKPAPMVLLGSINSGMCGICLTDKDAIILEQIIESHYRCFLPHGALQVASLVSAAQPVLHSRPLHVRKPARCAWRDKAKNDSHPFVGTPLTGTTMKAATIYSWQMNLRSSTIL